MSLKSVELQVAIPKTTEFSKIQNQHDLKQQHDLQDASTEIQKKQAEDRLRSHEVESSNKADIKQKQEHSQENETSKGTTLSQFASKEEEKNAEHPYKGKIVDISL